MKHVVNNKVVSCYLNVQQQVHNKHEHKSCETQRNQACDSQRNQACDSQRNQQACDSQRNQACDLPRWPVPIDTRLVIWLAVPDVSTSGPLAPPSLRRCTSGQQDSMHSHNHNTVQHTTTTVTPALGDMALTTTTVYNAQGHSHNCLYITTQQYTTALLTTCTYKQ